MLEAHRKTEIPRVNEGPPPQEGRRPAALVGVALISWLLGGFVACGGGGATGTTGTGGHAASSSSTSGGTGGTLQHTWTMGPPFATTPPPFDAVDHPQKPTPLWGALAAPYPTNTEWMNLVLGSGTSPINVLPYVINVTDAGFEVSLPKRVVTASTITSAIGHDISFRSIEAPTGHAVTAQDPLSVTMQWTVDTGKTITAPLVRGMPYVTAVYAGLTPLISTSSSITMVNGAAAPQVTGSKFTVTLSNGQTWVLYLPSSVAINWNPTGIAFGAALNGPLRAALVGSAPDAMDVLDKNHDAYPTGGDVAATVTGDTATVAFNWTKQGNGTLLMMALPHHLDALMAPTKTDYTLRTLKGDMVGVTGDAWTMTEPLSKITWSAPAGIAADKAADVKAALAMDATGMPAATDPYGFGKEIARLGRLALIADELADDATAKAIRDQMKTSLDPWLTGMNQDALKYDRTWGGVCSTAGLADSKADFGQGYYNDHHFHYGYFLYAAAALGKGDKAWLDSRKDALTALARDIANPSATDASFARFRNKDWFTGHSWAAGLFELGDSRDQESSSEAVNAWYGLYLLGLASADENLTNVGRVLLATEIRSVQKYWHIQKGSAIYDDAFAANKVVGILWSNKVDYSSFFCPAVECIHGIQMIPFTPMTEALLEPAWVTEEYPVLSAALTPASQEGFRGFAFLDHAVIDPATAYTEVQTLKSYDDGNSLTNSLYWVASRPAK